MKISATEEEQVLGRRVKEEKQSQQAKEELGRVTQSQIKKVIRLELSPRNIWWLSGNLLVKLVNNLEINR